VQIGSPDLLADLDKLAEEYLKPFGPKVRAR